VKDVEASLSLWDAGLMERAIKDVLAGREPPHVIRNTADNRYPHLLFISDMIPGHNDWKDYTRTLETEARGKT
jgi:hypothetical protein